MNRELLAKIDNWFANHRAELVEDLKRISRVPSVSAPWTPDCGMDRESYGPFGPACKQALEEMLQIGREHGFDTENYEFYVGSIGVSPSSMANTIGFWNHLDVVPVGNGWSQDPFEPVEKDGFLIGRGVQDNKGPAIGMVYLMQCIRELGIPMKHDLRLFVGCDEERGMDDLKYYTEHYSCPKLSMIADCGFPVCYGEKGIIEGQYVMTNEVSGDVLEALGGSASNMIPDKAWVLLAKKDGLLDQILAEKEEKNFGQIAVTEEADGIRVTASGTSRHSAFPAGSINAIHELSLFLMDAGFLCEGDRKQFSFLEMSTREYYGQVPGIDYEDEVSGKTTCAGTVLRMEGRTITLNLNIRYSITANSDQMIERLGAFAQENCAFWRLERDSKPGYFPKEHPAVSFLTDLYNEWAGLDTKAFVMGGGTYARKLPNAFAYGIGGMQENEDDKERKARLFRAGTGGAHEPDEGLNLRLFFEAMKFYTLAVIELDQVI
ncbi:MAG: Sapep family Mn(2+)-dependent dipeptidase [Lachnospiraceae bacterium]|nr:Sapep family Mn(2+)-dependent dipeptidase [Lachnospiraceae bacterium]